MVGKFLLRKDGNPNEYGEFKISLQYSTQGVTVKKSTGISVHPDYWLGDNGDGKYILGGAKGHPKYLILNKRLNNIKKEIDDKIDSLLVEKNQVIPVPILRSILNGTYDENKEKENGKISFVDFVLEQNKELYNLGKIGFSVWTNIECNMGQFKRFLQKEKRMDTNEKTILYCRNLTVQIIKDYINWKQSKNNTNDTINKALTPIFKTVKICCKKGWVNRDICDEICNLYLPPNSTDLDSETVKYLTDDQVKQLNVVIQNCKYERTTELFDMFMFSLYNCGLRFSDVATLRWDEVDITNRTIKHIQVKGHTRKAKLLNIPITDGGMKILEKWKGRNENFVFGLLSDEYDLKNYEKLKEDLNSKGRLINTSLKAIGDKINLPFNLHFHIARHTFATKCINEGVDIKAISTLMGHSTTHTTEKVYAMFMPSTLQKIAEEKLNFNF